MPINLIVKEPYFKKDVGRQIARFHLEKLTDVSEGDIIEIIGKRKTVAIAMSSSDHDADVLHIDGLIRKNAGLTVGSNATIQKTEVKDAQRVLLVPSDMKLNIDQDFINFCKNKLMSSPIIEGDNIFIVILGSVIPFEVARTLPHDTPLVIAESTEFIIYPEPISTKPTQSLDIKTISRKSWLENLIAVSKATGVLFSIENYNIEEENESKVINLATKIVEEKFETVRIDLHLTVDRDLIGTLPWIEIDIMGKIHSIYPDANLQPVYSSYKPSEINSLMSQCFKTGASYCPKVIDFNPKQIVVAIPFGDEI